MELVRSTSRGGYFVRSIFTFVLTVFLTALLWATFNAQSAHAQALPATWKGETIVYDGRQYYPAQAQAGESHGLPDGTTYYLAVETISEQPLQRKAHVIYFAPGADPPTATSANYVVYDYSASKEFSNAQGQKQIELDKKGEEGSYSACEVAGGIGWIVCPVAVFLADAMDSIFGFVAQFVEVPPVPVNDTNTPLFQVWNVMRSIANVAFIIAFLIIIYSQLTSVGVSNYGIKKLLPRLIVAAILVNVSFYLTAIAVDVSNIAGFSLQEILVSLRQDTFTITDGSPNNEATNSLSWANITAYVLSGGAAVAGVAAGLAATGGSAVAAVYLLIPLLLGLVLTVIFVFLVLAARQAIIIILIVVAPLAFVANLLPNTEKWFEKWKDLFMSMLIFFPAFALVFGGSQLAGGIIIQNADNVLMMIFGMAVQIAPLIITPLIIKLSGGLLGRIAGIINDPRRGAIDRAKNWSGARANMHKQRSLSRSPGDFKRSRVPWRNLAQRMDDNDRSVKARTAMYEKQSENRYLASDANKRIHEAAHMVDTDRKIVEGRLERDLNDKIVSDAHHYDHALKAANTTASAERSKLKLENSLHAAQSGNAPTFKHPSRHTQSLVNEAQELAASTAAHKQASANIDNGIQEMIGRSFNVELAEDGSNRAEYIASQSLLEIAKGTQGVRGVNRAKATAYATIKKLNREATENHITLFREEAIQHGQTLQDYAGDIIKRRASDDSNVRLTVSEDRFEAALQAQVADGKTVVLEDMRDNLHVDQKIIDRIADENISTLKSKGGFHVQAMPQLSLQRYIEHFRAHPTDVGVNHQAVASEQEAIDLYWKDKARARVSTLSNTPAEGLGSMKFGTFIEYAGWDKQGRNNFQKLLEHMDPTNTQDAATLQQIHAAVRVALEDDSIYGTITDRLEPARNIDALLSKMFNKKALPRRKGEPGAPPDDSDEMPDSGAGTPADETNQP